MYIAVTSALPMLELGLMPVVTTMVADTDEVSMEALSLPARHALVPLICVQQGAAAAQRRRLMALLKGPSC